MDEAELVRMVKLAQGGDEQALAWLFDRYQRRIVRFCLSFAPIGEQDAADVAQDAFVRAFGALNTLEKAQSFEPWLYTIARRGCLDMIRTIKRANQKRAALAHEAQIGPADEKHEQQQRQMERTIVAELIDELPDSDLKQAGKLFYRTGLDTRTIAQRMNAPVSTVTTWLNRFRAKIRKRLIAQVLSARGYGNQVEGPS